MMKQQIYISWGFSLFLIIIVLGSGISVADRGMMPVDGTVRIYEPGQKAIIAWNGTVEILILATDVYGESDTQVLEVIPLPGNPEIELGDISSFEKINRLIYKNYYAVNPRNNKSPDNIEVVFHEKLGCHDLTVIRVNDFNDFSAWVDEFKKKNNLITDFVPPEMDELISRYLEVDINYFAFDIIDVNENKKSVEPIIYKFEVDYLYYPLQISSIVNGDTEIFLFTLTEQNFKYADIIKLGFEKKIEFKITQNDLINISENFKDLSIENPHLYSFKFSGSLQAFDKDIMVGYVPRPIMIKFDNDNDIFHEQPNTFLIWLFDAATIILILICIVVLYTKSRKNRRSLLEPRVIEYIIFNHGDYFNNIKRALDTSTGNLSYIINKLEKEEIIKSRQFGQKRRFFPFNHPVKENFFMTKLQFNILDLIRHTPGLPQKDLANECGMSSENLKYHARVLLERGYIFTVSDGKMKRYYPNEENL